MVNKKLFTLEEVNQLLPRFRAEIIQLQQLKREFRVYYRKLKQKKAAISGGASITEDPSFELETTLEFLNIQMRGVIHRIQETGAQLKDIELGLIDCILATALLFLKFVAESIFLKKVASFLKIPWKWWAFFILQIFYSIYAVGIGAISSFSSFEWKGRKFKSVAFSLVKK